MPFKSNRGPDDAISRDNCTAYWLRGDGRCNNNNLTSLNGITGYLSKCGRNERCEDGFTQIGILHNQSRGNNAEIYSKQNSHIGNPYGSNVGSIWNLGRNGNHINYQVEPSTIRSGNHCGNICSRIGCINACNCGTSGGRKICKRTKPFAGKAHECCLESDPRKLMEMDCPPEWFATSDGKSMSNQCQTRKRDFCKEEEAYDSKTNKINTEYLNFCGCDYPDEYYDNLANDIISRFPGITTGQLGQKNCFAPTCVNADTKVQPNFICPRNNFQSCVNTVEINNEGIIGGDIEINNSSECQQFINEYTEYGSIQNNKIDRKWYQYIYKNEYGNYNLNWLYYIILPLFSLFLLIGIILKIIVYKKK